MKYKFRNIVACKYKPGNNSTGKKKKPIYVKAFY